MDTCFFSSLFCSFIQTNELIETVKLIEFSVYARSALACRFIRNPSEQREEKNNINNKWEAIESSNQPQWRWHSQFLYVQPGRVIFEYIVPIDLMLTNYDHKRNERHQIQRAKKYVKRDKLRHICCMNAMEFFFSLATFSISWKISQAQVGGERLDIKSCAFHS